MVEKTVRKENPYYVFITKLARDERATINGLADKYDLGRGFSSAIYRIRHDTQAKLHPETIGKIEKNMSIEIDDTDINNITYHRKGEVITEALEKFNPTINLLPLITEEQMDLLADTVSKNGKLTLRQLEELSDKKMSVPYDNSNAFIAAANSDRNEPYIQTGDYIVADLDENIKEGNYVIIILKNGEWSVGKYSKKANTVIVTYYNREYAPLIIDYKDLACALKVVKVIRDLS